MYASLMVLNTIGEVDGLVKSHKDMYFHMCESS